MEKRGRVRNHYEMDPSSFVQYREGGGGREKLLDTAGYIVRHLYTPPSTT